MSCIVSCTYCGILHESGDTWNSGSSWNTRLYAAPVRVTEGVIIRALEYGAHREGCPRAEASLSPCSCGWSDARMAALAASKGVGE